MAKGIVILQEDVPIYLKTLRALRTRMIKAFNDTDDMSMRKWINDHGPILDDLIEELKGRYTH